MRKILISSSILLFSCFICAYQPAPGAKTKQYNDFGDLMIRSDLIIQGEVIPKRFFDKSSFVECIIPIKINNIIASVWDKEDLKNRMYYYSNNVMAINLVKKRAALGYQFNDYYPPCNTKILLFLKNWNEELITTNGNITTSNTFCTVNGAGSLYLLDYSSSLNITHSLHWKIKDKKRMKYFKTKNITNILECVKITSRITCESTNPNEIVGTNEIHAISRNSINKCTNRFKLYNYNP